MTDPPEAPDPAPSKPPGLATPTAPSGWWRRPRVVTVAFSLVLAAVVSVGITDLVRSGGAATSPRHTPTAGTPTSADAATLRELAKLDAIRALLRRRSDALVRHDRAAFLATVDPVGRRFRAEQARMFRNLRRVHFASWFYRYSGTPTPVPSRARRRYHAPTFAFADFTVHYRIKGYDQHATDLPQYPTFVERNGHWYLGSLSDFRRRGHVSATDLWDYAPVHVIRRKSVLVLGPAAQLPTMASVAEQMQAAIPKVDAVWGRNWPRRVVVLVPSTQHEMARITADRGNLDQIVALTSSEVGDINGRFAPVGDRVTINPSNWPRLGTLGSAIVLTHELTHVATRAVTTNQTPKWLSEGFADYVGFRDTGVPVSLAAAELAGSVRAGHLDRVLPSNRDFRGSSKSLSQAYEAGWMACRYIAEHYGQAKLVRFYRAVGRSSSGQRGAVSSALHHVLHLRPGGFTLRVRHFVRSQLG